MKKLLILTLIITGLASPYVGLAHPGRTAADGCHYCRTNCDYWGVPWNQRHCHGGSTTPPPVDTSESESKTDYTTLAVATVEVTRVVDGDTIQVKFTDGTIEKVRLIGIDTPETVDPRKPVECFGKEASAKLKEFIEGESVRLERKGHENRGSYGRLLRYVYIPISNGDFFVNAEMIKQGYAYAYTKYPFDANLMEEFKQYEREAREKELGLWSPDACAGVATPITQEEEQNNQPLSANVSETVGTPEDTKDTGTSESSGWGWLWGLLGIAAIGGFIYWKRTRRLKESTKSYKIDR